MLPGKVISGFAEFGHLDTVEVKRCENDAMIGKKIPCMYTMNLIWIACHAD